MRSRIHALGGFPSEEVVPDLVDPAAILEAGRNAQVEAAAK